MDDEEQRQQQEQQLPEVLERLEIVPTPPAILSTRISDGNLPVSLNPFFYNANKASAIEANEKDLNLFGATCSCRRRRRRRCRTMGPTTAASLTSDLNLNSGGQNNNNNSLISTLHPTKLEHSIVNHASFKNRSNTGSICRRASNRKILLRPPVLKIIQSCIHRSHARYKRSTSTDDDANDSADEMPECPTLEALNLEDSTSTKKEINFLDRSNQFLDFKALVEECDIISTSSIGLCSGLKRNSKNFTTIQPYNVRPTTHNNNSRKLKKSQLKVINEQPAVLQNPNTSSSCSQQARISGASSTCDVTIDELASYFETFVHIPKKMSSMAEMMYI